MNDKQDLLGLLYFVAKAAGYWSHEFNCPDKLPHPGWNPLEDDGDALRLAVKLRMVLDVAMEAPGAGAGGHRWCSELHGNDPHAATRLAIVKAAAEIGRNIQ